MYPCGCSVTHWFGDEDRCACECHGMRRGGSLSPDEQADLAAIAANKAAGRYADDMAPIVYVGWGYGGQRVEHVTPWPNALGIE